MDLKKLLIYILAVFLIFQSYNLVFASNMTELVSLSSSGNQSNSFSYESSLSANGRFVVFTSEADNLVDNDTNNIPDIFLRDLELNKTEIVSLSHNGSFVGGFSPSISGDGRFVVFVSNVYNNEQSPLLQILLRDRHLNITRVVSVNDKNEMANSDCIEPVISENGLVVAFSSLATNLVEGLDEWTQNVFTQDLNSNKTELVSISQNGSLANSKSYDPSISGDGQFIAFTSFANNLVENDTNHAEDVFIRDRLNKITERISVANNGSGANRASIQPSISADGSLIAFTSQANNLVLYDNNIFRDVFVRDRNNNITIRASETVLGEGADLESMDPCISPDGRYIVFNSGYRDLVASTTPETRKLFVSDNNNTTSTLVTNDLKDYRDVFVKDLFTGEIWKISNPLVGIEANDHSYMPSISREASGVSYTSGATDLLVNDNNGVFDIYYWGTDIFNFALTGYVSPVSVQSGNSIKITASPSTVAEKVTAFIKDNYIDLKFLNGSWEGYYFVPNTEKSGKQLVELKAINDKGNTASLSLFFNVINIISTPNSPIVSVNSVFNSTIIDREENILNSKSTLNSSNEKVSDQIELDLGIKGNSKSVINDIKKSSFEQDLNSGYNDESWKYNNKDSVYGSFSLILNNPNNPLSHCFYVWDKFIQAGQEAWQTGNIWDFFDYPFYHIYGYSNLDKMWGGETIKFFLLSFFEIDSNGNMSIAGLLITVLSLIPIGRVASIGGKFFSKALPNVLSTLIKSKSVQLLLKSDVFQGLLKVSKEYLSPLTKIGEDILDKLPKWLPKLDVENISKGIKKISDIINLNPKTGIESLISTVKWLKKEGLNFKVDEWLINSNINRAANKLYDKLLLGKITSKDAFSILDGSIKLIKDGLKGGLDLIKSIFAKMDPVSVKYWVHESPWRMKNLSLLKSITSNNLYKDVHGLLSPVIKRNASIRSVYKAIQTIDATIKKIPETTKKAINTIKSTSKSIVKTSKKIITNTVKKVSNTVKKVVKKVTKSIQKVANKAKKVVKKVTKSIKKIVHKVKSTVKKITKTVKKAVKKVVRGVKKVIKKVKTIKKSISSGIKWLKKKIKWF